MDEIEVGQTWEQRNGKLIVIDEILKNNGLTPVRSGNEFWMPNGRYWDNTVVHTKDLIKLIK